MRSVYRRKRYKEKYGKGRRRPTEQKPTKQNRESTEDGRKEKGKNGRMGKNHRR